MFLSASEVTRPIGVVSVIIQSDYLYGSGGLQDYPLVMTMGILMMIPPIAVYIAFQKYFVEGLTVGGVK